MAGQAAGAVRPGGILVYATCSSEPDENEDVVAAFLDDHPDFEPVDPDRTGAVAPGLHAVLDDRGRLSTTPFDHGLDAFFAVVLRRGRPARTRRPPEDVGRPAAKRRSRNDRSVPARRGTPRGEAPGDARDRDGGWNL